MPSLSSLANIPGYGAYIAKKQMNEQQGMDDLRQISTLLAIKNTVDERQRVQQQAATQSAIQREMAAATTPEERRAIAMKYASPDAILRATQPDKPVSQPSSPEIIKLQQFLETLPPGHPARKPVEARIQILSSRQEPIQVNQFGSPVAGVDESGNPVFFQPARAGGAPQVIPGVKPPPAKTGDTGLTPENAGKVAMAQQSVDAIKTAREIIFDQNGDLNRAIVGGINLPIVAGLPMNSRVRIARSALRNAIEAKLRLETGAAATESEVERTLARFMPTPADTKESAKFKLDELEKFFKSSLSLTKGVKAPAPSADDPLGLRQ